MLEIENVTNRNRNGNFWPTRNYHWLCITRIRIFVERNPPTNKIWKNDEQNRVNDFLLLNRYFSQKFYNNHDSLIKRTLIIYNKKKVQLSNQDISGFIQISTGIYWECFWNLKKPKNASQKFEISLLKGLTSKNLYLLVNLKRSFIFVINFIAS